MAPNEDDAWAALAEQTRGADPEKGKRIAAALGAPTPEALIDAALRRARELAPGEARYRAQLALAEAGLRGRHVTSVAPVTHDDEKYIVPSATILARRVPIPPQPDVIDRQLHWVRAVVMHDDRRVSQMIQYAREIVIAPRTQEELYEEIPERRGFDGNSHRARASQRRRRRISARRTKRRIASARIFRWPGALLPATIRRGCDSHVDRKSRRRSRGPSVLFSRLRGLDLESSDCVQRGRRRSAQRSTQRRADLHRRDSRAARLVRTNGKRRARHARHAFDLDEARDRFRRAARAFAQRNRAAHHGLDVSLVGRFSKVVRGSGARFHRARRASEAPRG